MSVDSRARTMMVMRATVERDNSSTTDAYGHPVPETWLAHIASQPCRVWSSSRREVNDNRKEVLIESIRCAMPLGADVTEADRITSIKDRRGAELWAGPLRIDTIQHKHTHVEMDLTRVQA